MKQKTTQEIKNQISELYKLVFAILIIGTIIFLAVMFQIVNLQSQISNLPHKICENVTEWKNVSCYDYLKDIGSIGIIYEEDKELKCITKSIKEICRIE